MKYKKCGHEIKKGTFKRYAYRSYDYEQLKKIKKILIFAIFMLFLSSGINLINIRRYKSVITYEKELVNKINNLVENIQIQYP